MRSLAAFLLIALACAPAMAEEPRWKQELRRESVQRRADNLVIDEYSVCSVSKEGSTSLQIRSYAEAPAKVVSRDSLVSWSTMLGTLVLSEITRSGARLDCKTIQKPIGEVDVEMRLTMTADGFQWGGRKPPRRQPVLAHVQEHVGERIPDLARRAQHAQVVAPEQHRPLASKDPVHSSRESRRHGFHPARQRFLPGGLHHEVQVVALDRVLADAKVPALARLAEADSKFADDPAIAQRRNPASHAQCDVRRTARR